MELNILLNDKPLEAWVPFNEDGTEEVLIRYVPREKAHKILKRAQKARMIGRQMTEETDNILADVLLGQEAVRNWRGYTLDGEEFPCTPENIEIFMRRWNFFARRVNEVSVDLEMLMRAREETERKNSQTTSGPA